MPNIFSVISGNDGKPAPLMIADMRSPVICKVFPSTAPFAPTNTALLFVNWNVARSCFVVKLESGKVGRLYVEQQKLSPEPRVIWRRSVERRRSAPLRVWENKVAHEAEVGSIEQKPR